MVWPSESLCSILSRPLPDTCVLRLDTRPDPAARSYRTTFLYLRKGIITTITLGSSLSPVESHFSNQLMLSRHWAALCHLQALGYLPRSSVQLLQIQADPAGSKPVCGKLAKPHFARYLRAHHVGELHYPKHGREDGPDKVRKRQLPRSAWMASLVKDELRTLPSSGLPNLVDLINSKKQDTTVPSSSWC